MKVDIDVHADVYTVEEIMDIQQSLRLCGIPRIALHVIDLEHYSITNRGTEDVR